MTAPVDPRTAQPAETPPTRMSPPGLTADMGRTPDHGERSYHGHGRLAGRRALITGGDSGIGRAVAIAFAREGADVALSHLEAEEVDAEETLSWVQRAGVRGISLPGDLTDERVCRSLVHATTSSLGGLDLLVCNAAHQRVVDSLSEITTAQLESTFRTNVFATVWLVQEAAAVMPPGSTVLITSSIQAKAPSPHLLDYAATKAALANLTENLAQELAPRGIRVNAVAPGPIWTPLIPATMPDERTAAFGRDTPLGRAGEPAEVAPAYVFLASAEAQYITGAVLPVTGGELMF